MAIKKQFIKTKPVCKVTFSIEAKDATNASVVGDFNEWNPEEGLLKKQKNGIFKTTIELPISQSYEFRYIVDGAFINDEQADDFKWNEFADAENGVLVV
jgi:1,4-alpha-glucan branching enzyme